MKIVPGLFEETHVSEDDRKLLDVIVERGEMTTPEEVGVIGRFMAEYERSNTFR
jgi:hypothetical protein